MSHPEPNRRPRRWFQFSLRTLLVATAAAAALAFAYAKLNEPYRLQREAMAVISKLGGTYKTEDATGWVRYLDTKAQDVVVVDLAYCDKPDEYLPQLARLPRLRTLVVGGHSVGDEQLATLGRVGSLKGLVLDSTKVSDEEVTELKGTGLCVCKSERRACAELNKLGARLICDSPDDAYLAPQTAPPAWLATDVDDVYFATRALRVHAFDVHDEDLRWLANLQDVVALDLVGAGITDLGVKYIIGMRCLRHIVVLDTSIGDAGLAIMCRLPMIESLSLSMPLMTNEGLAPLAESRTLHSLTLDSPLVTDGAIRYLAKCAELTFLHVVGTGISPDGATRLHYALPMCAVFR